MDGIDLRGFSRLLLVCGHLAGFGLAAISVAFGDYAIFSGKQVNKALLQRAASGATLALLLLWATGVALIGMDFGFDVSVIFSNNKLLAKVTVVTVLTVNGLALHWFAFPRLLRHHDNCKVVALVATLLGVLSAATWVFAAFLGVVKPQVLPLSYSGFMLLYGLAVGAAGLVALVSVWSKLQRRLGENRSGENLSVQNLSVQNL